MGSMLIDRIAAMPAHVSDRAGVAHVGHKTLPLIQIHLSFTQVRTFYLFLIFLRQRHIPESYIFESLV